MQEKISSKKIKQEIPSKEGIGNRFKALRVERGISQQVMASILNLSRSNYSQIELGNQYPTFQTLALFSDYYGKSYEWVLHGDDIAFELSKTDGQGIVKKDIQFPKINTAEKKTIAVRKEEGLNYIEKSGHTAYIKSLPLLEIPQPISDCNDTIYRAFTVGKSNISLALYEDDIIIAKPIRNCAEVVLNNIFVVITSSALIICRISDFITESGVFIYNDNDDAQNLNTIKLADIREIWIAIGIYSSRSAPLYSKLTEQVMKFEIVLNSLQDEIQQLKKLLKA